MKSYKTILLAFIAAVGCLALAKPQRGINAAYGSEYAEDATAPTAADYIQDGLVALWDGVENAGWGLHDAEAQYWVDLSGHGRMLPIPTTWYWVGNAAIADDKSALVRRKDGDLEAMKNGYTIEVVVQAFADETITYPSGDIAGIGEGCSLSLYNNQAGCFFTNKNQFNGYGTTSDWRWYSHSSTKDITSFSMVCDIAGVSTRCYVNGEKKATYSYAGIVGDKYPSYVGFGVNSIAGYKSGTNVSRGLQLGGAYFCIRYYSIALSDEEVASNFLIDQERFGIGL